MEIKRPQLQHQLASGESTANPSPPPPQQTQTRRLPPTGPNKMVRDVTPPSATAAYRERETPVGSKIRGEKLAQAVAERGEGEGDGGKGVPTRGRKLFGAGRVPTRGDGEDNKSKSASPRRLLGRGGEGGGEGERERSRSVSPRRMVRGDGCPALCLGAARCSARRWARHVDLWCYALHFFSACALVAAFASAISSLTESYA